MAAFQPTAEPFDGDAVLAFLARRAIPGVERVQGRVYERADLRLEVMPAGVLVHRGDAALARRLFDLDGDPAAIAATLAADAALAPLVAARPGLRAPGAADPVEVLARAIVGQQISVAATRTILGRLASGGERFPPAAALARLDPATLPMPRARARAFVGAMAAVAQDAAIVTDRTRLLALPGVGPWTADYIALRLGDRDAFLPGDLIARRAMAALGMEPGRDERWRPLRAYALHHLWTSRLPGCVER